MVWNIKFTESRPLPMGLNNRKVIGLMKVNLEERLRQKLLHLDEKQIHI